MPQTAKPSYSGLLSKWLPNPGPIFAPLRPSGMPVQAHGVGLRGAIQGAMNYEPLRNRVLCNIAKNVWTGASQLVGTGLDTPTEKAMMGRYFGGGGGSYRLSPAEWDAAARYYNIHRHKKGDDSVLINKDFNIANGGHRQNVAFAKYDDEPLDGLLGTATGYFDRDKNITGLRDTFDFDDAPRDTGYPIRFLNPAASFLAGKTVGLAKHDADIFCPGGSNPVTILGGSRR